MIIEANWGVMSFLAGLYLTAEFLLSKAGWKLRELPEYILETISKFFRKANK